MNITALLRRMVLIVLGSFLVATIAVSPALAKGHSSYSEREDNIHSLQSGDKFCFACDLSDADLSQLDLSKADLSNSILIGANLSGTNLSEASLYGAFLQSADLSGADLTSADLNGADLTFANLKGAKVTLSQLESAYKDQTTYPDGHVSP